MKWLVTYERCSIGKVFANSFCTIANKTLEVGKKAAIKKLITADDVRSFADLTKDYNPIHCRNDGDAPVIVHGAFLNGLVSAVIGTKLPGPGSVLAEQLLKFPNSCYVGETVTVEVEIISVRKIIECQFICHVENKVVLCGTAKLVLNKNFPSTKP